MWTELEGLGMTESAQTSLELGKYIAATIIA